MLKRFPKLLFTDRSILSERRVFHQGIIITRDYGAAARGRARIGTHPIEIRHPFIAPDRNAQASHIFYKRANGSDLFVSAGQTALRVIQWRTDFNDSQIE